MIMVRRPASSPGYTIGQGGRGGSPKPAGPRCVLLVGISLASLGIYLYARAIRAVILQEAIITDRQVDDGSGIRVMAAGGRGGRRKGPRRVGGKTSPKVGGARGDGKRQSGSNGRSEDRDRSTFDAGHSESEIDPASKTEEFRPFAGTSAGERSAHDNEHDGRANDGGGEVESAHRTPWHGAPPPTPAWWMESDPDRSFERTYLSDSERRRFKHLRDLGLSEGGVNRGDGIKHFFNPLCWHYVFNETAMPTVSVIMTSQNDPDAWISISVESILARTPPGLLREVIVVDDNGVPGKHGLPADIRKNVDEEEWDYIKSLSPKVKVIHHDNREGCGRSRLAGARVATGDVLMFVDSHIEMMSSTWYQHLVIPIMENPHTIAMQTIDVIDDLGTNDYGKGRGPPQYGIVNTDFWFGYQADRFGDYMEPIDPQKFTAAERQERRGMKYKAEVPHTREPYETPFGPGSLFAIRADEFWRLGGYDEGLYVWGGENTEMAFKMWMCGGRMLMVPCSRVGHMYRQHKEKDGRGALSRWPPTLPQQMSDRYCVYKNGKYTGRFVVLGNPADNFTRIATRNNMRVMEAWVGDHPAKRAYYKHLFGQETPKPEFQRFIDEWRADPFAQKQVQLRKQNKCHDFQWWDRHVFMRLTGRHHPWHPDNKKNAKVSCGQHKARSCELCPQGKGKDWCNGECTWCSILDKCFATGDVRKLCKPATKNPRISSGAKMGARKIPAESGGATKQKEGALHLPRRERARLTEAQRPEHNGLTLSVVLPCGFEHGYFIRTAESVFYETPEEVLKEIVLVDDASDPPLEESWPAGDAARFGVKYVRLASPHGLIGAKQAGAEAATGDIIVFFDCHVKPAADYWVPYVRAVHENYKRAVVPTITNLNIDTWEEFGRPTGPGGGMSKCYLTFDAEFKWTTDDTPYVPIMSGGLLAISRKWFFEIGGYDSSMKGWGGENLDQSLRIWTCGGEIVSAPQSYVAHMWRDGTAKTKARYKLDAGDAVKNRARAVKAHLGQWYEKTLTFPSFSEWHGKELDTSSITEALSALKCDDFEWYLNRFKNIYRDAGVVPREVFQIEAVLSRASDGPLCLELEKMMWTNYGTSDRLVLKECAGSPSKPRPIWWHGSNRLESGGCCGSIRAWNTDQCIDGRNPRLGATEIMSFTCNLDSGREALLQPIGDNKEEFSLVIGKNSHRYCISVEGGTSLKTVQCQNASPWRKRSAFTPMEYALLSIESKNEWEKEI